jgi:hypothetical protein
MLKRLLVIIIVLLAGLAINAVIYDKTFNTDPALAASFVCKGENGTSDIPPPASSKVGVKVSGGEPLNTSSTVTVVEQTCTGQYSAPTFRLADFIKSWQFYANWLIWSLPLFGIVYLINGRYAYSRH